MNARPLALLLLALAGCAVPVAAGLDEQDANQIVVALDHAKIDALRETDPGEGGKLRVTVARDDVPRALAALANEGLPRARPRGVLDALEAMGTQALVPSLAQEHAQIVAGMAGDLERSLASIDGIVSARVHLNLPARDPFRDAPAGKASASVLFEHRGATPPISTDAVQRLVAGGAPGLSAIDVTVVSIPRVAAAHSTDAELAHVGPFAVARSSLRPLQATLAGFVLLSAALAALALAFYARATRRAEAR